jgi:hypothetical protein
MEEPKHQISTQQIKIANAPELIAMHLHIAYLFLIHTIFAYLGQFGVVFLDEIAQVAGGHSNKVGAGPGVSGNVHFAESAVGNGVTEGSATQSINHLYWSFVQYPAFICAMKDERKRGKEMTKRLH